MKKLLFIVLILSSVLWLSAASSANRASATLSYHGDVGYYFHLPDQYGDEEFGIRFTPVDDCTLSSANFMFYNPVGSPTGITVHIYDSMSNMPNTELGSLVVDIADLSFYPDWTTIDLSSLNLSFSANQDFFITYTVNGGESGVTEVPIISDDGSGTNNRAIERYGTTWGYMVDDWGGDYEFFIEATIEYTQEPDPMLEISPDSLNFGKTAIGGKKYETVTLSNIGGGYIVINSVSLFGNSQFVLSDANTYPDTLYNSESIHFDVIYTPTGEETNTTTLNIDETSVPASRTTHHVPVSGEGYIHNSWASGTPIYDQSPTGNQGDYSWSAGTSDAAPSYLRADNFSGLTSPISAVEFWGINWYHDSTGWHASDVEDPMTFDIKFYNNSTEGYGLGTLVDSFSVTLSRTTVDSVTFGGAPVYMYHATLDRTVDLSEGWLSIQGTSVSSPTDPWFLWVQSPIGDYYTEFSDDNGENWYFDYPDLSFALYSETILPPSDVSIEISGGNAIISWTSQSGYYYNVYSDTDPYGSFGTLLGTVTDGSGQYTDSVGSNEKKFYRVTSYTTTRSTNHYNSPVIILPTRKPMLFNKNMKVIDIKK